MNARAWLVILFALSASSCNFRNEILGSEAPTDPKQDDIEAARAGISLTDSEISAEYSSLDPDDTMLVTLTLRNFDGELVDPTDLTIGFRMQDGTSEGEFSEVEVLEDGSCQTTFTAVRSGDSTKIVAFVEDVGVISSDSTQVSVNFLAPPSALSYDSATMNTTVGEAITANTATVTGVVEQYTVSPDLPLGLFLDAKTGEITGVPLVVKALETYTITAENPLGSTTFEIDIEALAAP